MRLLTRTLVQPCALLRCIIALAQHRLEGGCQGDLPLLQHTNGSLGTAWRAH